MRKGKFRLSSAKIIALGFAALIITGTVLLMLPVSTADGQGASFIDALFTAVSASCVTGLVVHDTATYWSVFGKLVIITLIQIGGMGVVTFALAIFKASGKKISLKQRSVMQESVSGTGVGGIVRLTGFIVTGTFIFEAAGAALLAPAMIKEFGVLKGILYSLFHSVSAFCNAGFDLMGVKGQYSSLTSFADNHFVNTAVILLIVIGGLGFLTWDDIRTHKFRVKKYRLQSKISLFMAAVLITIPALFFFFAEFGSLPFTERLQASVFQSVTCRTAGFNTADLGAMSESGQFIMIMLMLTGGSPGSTAGGMKTTTIAVLAAAAVSVFRRRSDPHFFGRRVDDGVVRRAVSLIMMYISLFVTGGIIISLAEGLPLLTCMFESASAVATVGLTLGITPSLSLVSKIVLILLMYFGRLGGLTVVLAAVNNNKTAVSKMPREDLNVG